MSNRRRLTQVEDKHRSAQQTAAMGAEYDLTDAHPSHEHHQASVSDIAREQGIATRARSSESAMLAAQANTMRLKKGNSSRHG
jgi:hypothetical protein